MPPGAASVVSSLCRCGTTAGPLSISGSMSPSPLGSATCMAPATNASSLARHTSQRPRGTKRRHRGHTEAGRRSRLPTHGRRRTRRHACRRDIWAAYMVHSSSTARGSLIRYFGTPSYRVMEPHERVIFDAWGPCPCQPGAYLASFVIIRAGYPRTRSVFFRSTDTRRYTRRSGPTDRETLSAWLLSGPGLANRT